MKLSELKCVNKNINLDEYIKVREYVKKNMEHPEWLGDFTKEDLIYMLNNGSTIRLYYLNDHPVCSMMLIPADIKSINKFKLKLNYKEVADYGPMFVIPELLGNNLQYQMLLNIDEFTKNKGYKYALTTIHPDNIYSINNILKDNFIYDHQITLKRGKRNIYLKKLNKN